MKKKTLIFLLSTCLLTQSAGFVSAADFSAIPAENVNAEENFSPEDTSISSDYLPVTDDVSDESSDDTASETDSETSDVLPDTDTVTDSDSETLSEETVPENIEIEPEASPAEDDSDDLLFSDGESEDFNDGSDFSTIVSAASEIPDHDMWIADTVKSGLVVDGKNIQTKSLYNLITQASVKPVYQELGERILSNKPMLVLSSIWKGVIKQEFYDNQKLIYEALLTDYLRYVDSTDSKGFDMSQFERANSYLIKIFNDLSNYYLQKGIYDWKPEDFMKLDAKEANKLFHSVDSMKTAISLVGDTCSTTKELIELCSKVNAFKNAADERILLIQKARDAGSSNTAFAEACDVILAQLNSQSIDVSYLRSQSASAAMKKCTETMISELSKQNPALKALSYGSSAMDILFNTSNINSDNLKLSLLYTMDCYFNTAMTSSSFTYARYKNAENATTFTKCFQGYTMFQLYGNSVAKSYISGVTSGGTLNRTFADIFYREGVQSANEWQSLCDTQNNIRRNILSILANFYQIYNRFYLKDEYTNALKDQTPATPTPTPKPLVPVDYNVTLPESKNPVKEKSSGFSSVKWTLFENGNLFFYGEGILSLEDYDHRYVTGNDAKYKNDIKRIFISEGITGISYYTFSGFSNLTSVSLSDSVLFISFNSFENCTSLQDISMSQKLETISTSAFINCQNLQTISFPETLSAIGEEAFKGCSNLKCINIPDHTTRIGKFAFEDCSHLESATLLGSLYYKYDEGGIQIGSYYSLEDGLFRNCTNLKTVVFKKDNLLGSIQCNTFENCSSLEKISFPKNISYIGSKAFYKCTNLLEINLPSELQTIDEEAFKNCTRLTKITFPSNSNYFIDTGAFQNCISLKNVNITGTPGKDSFSDCVNLTNVTLHKAAILDRAFKNCKNLTNLVLPDNPGIGEESFSGCSKLKNISVPHGIGFLSKKSFYNCTSLQSIVLDPILQLEKEEFVGCTNLKSITFLCNNKFYGNSNIEKSSVEGCKNLKIIYGYKGLDLEYAAKYIGAKFVALDKPPKLVPSLKISIQNGSFKATWNKISNVAGYEIEYSDDKTFAYSNDQGDSSVSNKTSSVTFKSLTPNQTYYVRIRAYNIYAETCYGKWSTPKAVTILPIKISTIGTPTLKNGKQSFKVSWKKAYNTNGYQIQYSLYKNFKKPVTKTLTGNTKTSITVSRLKRKKRYYVRVRAYRNANSKKYYGKWSKTKSIVVK